MTFDDDDIKGYCDGDTSSGDDSFGSFNPNLK